VDLEVRSRDPEDRIEGCSAGSGGGDGSPAPAPPAASNPTAPRVDFYARRLHRRGSVLRSGLKATCAATEAGTCSVTGSISRGAARALGIRTRARRYVIARGTTAIPGHGPNAVQIKLSPRARAALRGRVGLRVLLSATMVDRAGNRATDLFTVTLRG
jgi:hypothetical protein